MLTGKRLLVCVHYRANIDFLFWHKIQRKDFFLYDKFIQKSSFCCSLRGAALNSGIIKFGGRFERIIEFEILFQF